MKMKNAFTMIELIFVIVIIGVLAAVAIPKLTLTRSDAEASNIVQSLAQCINDAGGEYMMTASFHALTQDANLTKNCKIAKTCFDFNESDVNGTLTVNNLASSDKKCIEAQSIASENILAVTHSINF